MTPIMLNSFVGPMLGIHSSVRFIYIIISTKSNNDTFIICPRLDYERFAHKVLGGCFKHRNFSCFVRQLNMYGSHKIPHLQQGVSKSDTETEILEFCSCQIFTVDNLICFVWFNGGNRNHCHGLGMGLLTYRSPENHLRGLCWPWTKSWPDMCFIRIKTATVLRSVPESLILSEKVRPAGWLNLAAGQLAQAVRGLYLNGFRHCSVSPCQCRVHAYEVLGAGHRSTRTIHVWRVREGRCHQENLNVCFTYWHLHVRRVRVPLAAYAIHHDLAWMGVFHSSLVSCNARCSVSSV